MELSGLPALFTPAEAAAGGVSKHALLGGLAQQQIERVGHGLYRRRAEPASGERWELALARHLDRLRVELRRHPGHVGSHTSAALVHGLELMIAPGSPVELTALERSPRSRREDGLILHHSDSGEIPVVEIAGIRVTSLPRTIADTLRTRSLAHGTAMLDAALRAGAVTDKEVLAVLEGQRRWRGRPKALAAMMLRDPRRESWLESFSFVRLHERGIPLPLAQVDVTDSAGNFRGRPDGLLPELGSFLEADGSGKYFLDAQPDETVEQTVLRKIEAERMRHRGLEDLGLRGVRWSPWEVMHDLDAVVGRIRQQLVSPPESTGAYVEWDGRRRRIPFEVDRPSVDPETLRTRRRRSRHGW